MTTINIPPSSPFSRRVSFNNLDPESIDPSLTKVAAPGEQITFKNPTFGYGTSLVNDISKAYNSTATFVSSRRRSKLPDPPSKSILKNKLSQQQLQYNIENADSLGISYHGDLNDLADHPPDHVPRSELAYVEGSAIDDDEDDEDDEEDPVNVPPARRKLYSGMTDEELMALDPQFATTKPKVSLVDQFKFDLQTTYYLPAKRTSMLGASAASSAPRLVYPSSNENNYKSISLTLKHTDYELVESKRTLLTIISGRKHSWNSLDWLVTPIPGTDIPTFLQNGDYLVVTALLPTKTAVSGEKRRGSSLAEDLTYYRKCENILNYIIRILPSQELKLKITVEFVLEPPPMNAMTTKTQLRGMKLLLTKIYNQYHPTLVVVGNRSTNLNFKYPLRVRKASSAVPTSPPPNRPFGGPKISDRYLIKLSSYLVKYSTVPVILVGNKCCLWAASQRRKGSSISQNSSDDDSLESDVKSFSGKTELETSLLNAVNSIRESDAETRFQDLAILISDRSLGDSRNYLETLKSRDVEGNSIKFDDSVEFNSKIHSIYKSQSNSLLARTNGEGAYKVKSLISYDPVEEKKNEEIRNSKKLEKIKSSTSSKVSAVSSRESSSSSQKVKPKKSFWKKIGIKKL